jgi:hypothetical protein
VKLEHYDLCELIFLNFFIAVYLSLGEASMKDGQAEGEAFSLQKITFGTSKDNFLISFYFCG